MVDSMRKFKIILVLAWVTFFVTSYAEIHEVVVQDNNFTPANLGVLAGDTIRWFNQGNNNHNVASTDLNFLFRCAAGCDDTGGNGDPAGNGWISEVTFHQVDASIPYICEPHVGFGMTGSISIQTPTEFATVEVSDANGFEPQSLTIVQNTRVRFTNAGGAHNMAADDDSFRCAHGCRDDGIEGVDEFTGFPWQIFMKFTEPGSYAYHCQNPAHTETGVIHVLSDAIFENGFDSL